MAAEGELVHGGTLATEIEDANLSRVNSWIRESEGSIAHLRVRNTTVVPTLRVGLVLAVAVAASGTATHLVRSL